MDSNRWMRKENRLWSLPKPVVSLSFFPFSIIHSEIKDTLKPRNPHTRCGQKDHREKTSLALVSHSNAQATLQWHWLQHWKQWQQACTWNSEEGNPSPISKELWSFEFSVAMHCYMCFASFSSCHLVLDIGTVAVSLHDTGENRTLDFSRTEKRGRRE